MAVQRNLVARCLLAAVLTVGRVSLAQDADRVGTLPEVTVIQRTPLPGLTLPRSLYPGNAQQANDAQIERARAASLPEFLQRRFAGVSTTDATGNPWQPDLLYRGQRLSGTLGAAQGLTLWLDGVRLNQPLGGNLAWSLLPEAAVADVVLVPGSDPLHGLNTLGGALVLTSKSGLTHAGTEAEATLASPGRRRVSAGHGVRAGGGWHAYVAGSAASDRGWREHSGSRLANVFVRVGRQDGRDGWSASLLDADSRLSGHGLVPEPLARGDWRAAYTWPDTSRNRDTLLSLRAEQALPGDAHIAWQLFHRRTTSDTRQGDVADDWVDFLGDCAADPGRAACAGAVPLQAVVRTTATRQQETGAAAQWSATRGPHRLTAGAEIAQSRSSFLQASQGADFDAQRAAAGVGATAADAVFSGQAAHLGLFAAATTDITPDLQLTTGARWDRTVLRNDLQVPAPATHETFRYARLNPAVGATWRAWPAVTLFANASQGTRMPTPLELGCADPARPCVLPTGLQSDPYLRAPVARTLELGARTRRASLEAAAAVFRTDTADDIAFVRSQVSQAGYFANAGATRRQGVELSLRDTRPVLSWSASYAFTSATYRSALDLPGPLSSAATPNAVSPGSPIAGVPRHLLKLAADWRVQPRLVLGADLVAAGSQAVAGNEGGSRPELGRLPGYAVLHARARWHFDAGWEADLRVANVLDRRYATSAAGNLDLFPGGAALRPGQAPAVARFIAPGAPRMVVVGLRYEWE